jgi:GxxExxY protein
MTALLYRDETFKIIGACFEVYNEKGHGFLETVYQACLEIEMTSQGIPYESQTQLDLFYRDEKLALTLVPDLICYGKVIVELKAVKNLEDAHRAQLMNYLRATGMELGILVNFGHFPRLQWERIVLINK